MNSKRVVIKLFLLSLLTVCLLLPGMLSFAVEGNYVGSEKCAECHADLAKAHATSIHSKAGAYGVKDAGCESCHGPGGNHVVSGDKGAIVNPARADQEAASAQCLSCHSKGKKLMYWHGSMHEGLSCVACHKVHGGNDALLVKANELDLCFSCHIEVRADIFKRSKHPMRDSSSLTTEGKMTCSACHNVHGARAERLIDAKSFNDKCYECHAEKRAPLLWEHSPVKEDCLTCHDAHGSSNDKMLVTKVPRLCQECHMQGSHQTGALATNSTFVFNRSCLNCHTQIHGSNNPSGTVLQR